MTLTTIGSSATLQTRTLEVEGFPIAELISLGEITEAKLLIEVPHGATEAEDLERAKQRLSGPLPPDLSDLFFVNTDFGAPEVAKGLLEALAPESAVLLRCRIPRVLIDPNRVLDTPEAGMTPAIPAFVTQEADRALLRAWHEAYISVAQYLYTSVCGGGGYALALHSYAPRSIAVDIDRDGIAALRREYESDRWGTWPLRPEVDLITRSPDGKLLASPALVAALRSALEAEGLEVRENTTYTLHPATWGARFAKRHPEATAGLELRRDLLGNPWRPFEAGTLHQSRVERLGQAMGEAVQKLLAQSAKAGRPLGFDR